MIQKSDKPKFDTSSENITWAIKVLCEIERPTEEELSTGGMSREQIASSLSALTRGMQMFDIILSTIENAQADSQTELLQKLIDERAQWTCRVISALQVSN
jgi:hypothetical protein